MAKELLGKALLRKIDGKWVGGLIVETEAYLSQDDLASHSARGKTASNASMFGLPGTLYVYPIHAKYCLNAVTEAEGSGSAVLIRAIEPIWGIETMRQRRGLDDERRLTRGPAMLCQALGVDRSDDGIDLVEHSSLTIATPPLPPTMKIDAARRIGISKSVDDLYRFFVNQNRFVSGRARDHSS